MPAEILVVDDDGSVSTAPSWPPRSRRLTETESAAFGHEIEEESTRQLEATGLFRDVVIAQLTTSVKSAIRERGRTSVTQQHQHVSEQRSRCRRKDQAGRRGRFRHAGSSAVPPQNAR